MVITPTETRPTGVPVSRAAYPAESFAVVTIGAAGMGKVYRATDTKLGRDVALKVLPPDGLLRCPRDWGCRPGLILGEETLKAGLEVIGSWVIGRTVIG